MTLLKKPFKQPSDYIDLIELSRKLPILVELIDKIFGKQDHQAFFKNCRVLTIGSN